MKVYMNSVFPAMRKHGLNKEIEAVDEVLMQHKALLEALKISRAYIASRCGTPDPEDRFADQVLIEVHKQIDEVITKVEQSND